MKHAVPIVALVFASVLSPLHAGDLITITDGIETSGKLSFTGSAVHLEGFGSPTDTNLGDVLEAIFSDDPFQLNCFTPDKGSQLPPEWKAQDIGDFASPGSASVTDGTFSLTEGTLTGAKKPRESDSLYFLGQPWIGDGQWTLCVKDIANQAPETRAGLMLRDTLDATSAMVSVGTGGQGDGSFVSRTVTGRGVDGTSVPLNLPVWLRLTRYGATFFASYSSDGSEWNTLGRAALKISPPNPWVGAFVHSTRDKGEASATIDQVSFTPVPSLAEVLPPGVLLQDGTFLAGSFQHLAFDSASPDAPGNFVRAGKAIPIPPSKIAAILMLPISRSQIADMNSHVGVLMKNGDIIDGQFSSINGNDVVVSSVLLGITTYNQAEVRGCFLQPLQPQPAPYEVRLREGSIVNASDIRADATTTGLTEISGLDINVATEDIAQIRAGSAQVENLAEANWHASPSSAAQAWQGPNQEQVIEIPSGASVDFPLNGRFRALGVRVALSNDSPPGANATIRILADGQELARTPPFKAGEQPRFMQVTFSSPKNVTLEADSIVTNAKILFIDPVALRSK